ncbi:MAG: Eco57I restriction-modification methylase domain-containing protein, partial [Bacteroidota bacterium]
GWLMKDPEFIYHFWKDYLNQKKGDGKKCVDFHEKWLNKLFFTAFNGKAYQDRDIFRIFPAKYKEAILEFPFLNGGLFTQTDEDKFLLDDSTFDDIFQFFQSYIFTISEDTADEINLEINPELLGKMYEGMINATDLDDVDAENGIVYTERPEINFMTRRSFVEVLHKKLPDGKYSREFLYHFCFDKPDAKIELLKKYKINAEEIRQIILSITALDPACGSGSMLIGVIQLQLELLKCLYEYQYNGKSLSPRDEFLLKKQIISESIYGVDIKEWAVRIAELRFWLYMIADAEFTTEELVKEPLLPNLDFKLRQGDSLIQEIGNIDFSLKGLFKGKKRNVGATRKLNEFIKKKKEFIANNTQSKTSYKKLKEEELYVFRTFIDELLIENTQRIKQLEKGDGQQKMFDAPKDGNIFQSQIDALKQENQQLKKVKESIKDKGRLPFSYDIDFMEIFIASDDSGFDLVIGNPPYVQQEDIIPAHDAMELERLMLMENRDEKARVARGFKEKLSQKVFNTYPFLSTTVKVDEKDESGNPVLTAEGKKKQKTIKIYGNKVPGQSDLYVYFQLLCPYYLNTKGTFCFIISNSWMDVKFGGFVQQFLLKHTDLYAIYDCNIRSFTAKVNTVIYLHSALKNINLTANKYKTLLPVKRDVKFVMNKADYTDTAYAPLLIEQESCKKNTYREFYRVIIKSQNELWTETYDEETFSYLPNKWGGKYLRAPEIYFKILEKGDGKFVPLKEIAEVRRGITSGANDFFILSRLEANRWKIEEEFLVPILKSPRECKTIKIKPKNLEKLLFYCNKEKKDLKGTNALKYIEWGEKSEIVNGAEKRAFHTRPSTRVRRRWWDIGNRKISQTVIPCGFGDSFKFYKNGKVFIDKRLYEVDFLNSDYNTSLNSTLTVLFLEVNSRTGLGDGLMDITVYEAKEIQVFKKEFHNPIEREVESIFKELGFDPIFPIRLQQPKPINDRFELDSIIFRELNLTNDEINEIYWATAELVKSRIDRADTR